MRSLYHGSIATDERILQLVHEVASGTGAGAGICADVAVLGIAGAAVHRVPVCATRCVGAHRARMVPPSGLLRGFCGAGGQFQ